MQKKIIHIVLGKANPNRQNGVNKVVNSIATEQKKKGLDVELFGITRDLSHNYPDRNYPTSLFLDSKAKFFLDKALISRLENLNPENTVIHLHGAFLPQLWAVAKILIRKNIEYVFTPHGGYNFKALAKSSFQKRIYLKAFERLVVANAKYIQLIGESEREGLDKFFNYKRLVLIPNGQEEFHYVGNTIKLVSNAKKLSLVYLGRIDIKTKGLDLLLEAISMIKNEIDLELNIIGSDGDIIKLKQMVHSLNLSNHVKFLGPVFGDEKYTLLANADVLCLVSRNEGLPGCVLEAAAVGTPSLISEFTNLQSYIQEYDSGYNLLSYDAKSLSELISEIYNNKNEELRAKSENAMKMISKAFSWGIITEKLNICYV